MACGDSIMLLFVVYIDVIARDPCSGHNLLPLNTCEASLA
jgi:hypothetical protein